MPGDDVEEYPHWRTALFGNGHAANLYCGIKYILWHLIHLVFATMAVVLVVVIVPLFLVWRTIRYIAIRVAGWLDTRLPGDETKYEAKARVSVTAEKIREAPVTRRVYGYCPVDLKLDPRWFEALGEKAKALHDWASPPQYVWVCDECSLEFSWEPSGSHRHCEGEFQKVVEGSDEHRELASDTEEVFL